MQLCTAVTVQFVTEYVEVKQRKTGTHEKWPRTDTVWPMGRFVDADAYVVVYNERAVPLYVERPRPCAGI